ncbi:LuxR C-terminal-related transcriptional regulator [uncultured Ramlibacter sp.]|uniref:LuxR C-terminal-related transcriptional regulator n=1 Tax=uncultured Ramlibacter sp. TaxID=260755 RepID=UPI0026390A2F|nr:LuxR C-terminal-related transcriptional regulator [uncultured Ramlibacter sp.]
MSQVTDPRAPPSDLLLKVTPPRVPRHLVARPMLAADHPQFRDRAVVLVQAPPGFGKTSLLAQWRLDHLARGGAVAWLTAQTQDDGSRFVQALALAVRSGAGRPTFGHALLEAPPPGGLEGITAWLAELAHSARDIVLIVDEADRLSEEPRAALAYLLRNAPPNLRCVVGARSDWRLDVDDLVAYGQCVVIGANHLRFGVGETLALMRERFGADANPDEAARLYEMTEGWPLGLQLALSVMGSADGSAQVPRLDLHGGALRTQFVGRLLGNLDPADLHFLTLVSAADPLHPGLCRAIADAQDAPQRLARLQRDTPILVAGEHSEWMRMHALAREALRRHFDALPAAQQAGVHSRAAQWLAGQGLLDGAAVHALEAGEPQRAYELAERSLYESLMTRGRQGAVLEWLARLPPEELDRRPRLLLAAAWSLALGERNDEAQRMVARLLAQPGVDDSLRCECALVLGGAAIFADEPDRFAGLHDPWAEAPPLKDPLLLQIHANRMAFRALLDGEPALARLRQQAGPGGGDGPGAGYLQRWRDLIIGLSYLWEGQVTLAEQLLRPVLARTEADLGRRNPVACMLAALQAAALWERGDPHEAEAVLANRLDVLERSGLPECVLLGYRTLARIATSAGAENRALELLGALEAVGTARQLPRLRIASLAEQVRLHARSFRGDTCRALLQQIDELLRSPDLPSGPLWERGVRPLQLAAQSYAAIAARDWRGALEPLARADEAAVQLKQGRLHIELQALRALALHHCGERAEPLLREASELAQSHGLRQVLADAHPALAQWLDLAQAGAAAERPPQAPARAEAARPRALPSMALTPKEREVLELVARNLSNKEIGRALQVGEETIKWHMKNLLAKLDAGTRKEVVARARIFGLLSDAN